MYSEKTVSEFLASLKGQTADEKLTDKKIINEKDKAKEYAHGECDNSWIYKYTDKDLVNRLIGGPSYPLREEMNDLINNLSLKYDESDAMCPVCGAPIESIGNDGLYCKNCGQRLDSGSTLDIGGNLKNARKGSGLKIKEVSDKMGISVSKISNIETNKIEPRMRELSQMAEIYGCSINDLLDQTSGDRTDEPQNIRVIKDNNGWDWSNTAYEYTLACPTCGKRIDPTPIEALSINLSCYEHVIENTEGNDGNYCKHCGTRIARPFKTDMKKARNNFDSYIEEARRQITKKQVLEKLPIKKTV